MIVEAIEARISLVGNCRAVPSSFETRKRALLWMRSSPSW